MITKITDHAPRATNRFVTQYKESDIKKVAKTLNLSVVKTSGGIGV